MSQCTHGGIDNLVRLGRLQTGALSQQTIDRRGVNQIDGHVALDGGLNPKATTPRSHAAIRGRHLGREDRRSLKITRLDETARAAVPPMTATFVYCGTRPYITYPQLMLSGRAAESLVLQLNQPLSWSSQAAPNIARVGWP